MKVVSTRRPPNWDDHQAFNVVAALRRVQMLRAKEQGGLTEAEIGKQHGITRSRVNQLASRAKYDRMQFANPLPWSQEPPQGLEEVFYETELAYGALFEFELSA